MELIVTTADSMLIDADVSAKLCWVMSNFLPNINIEYTTVEHYAFLKGLNAHYHIMSEDDYYKALSELWERI